MEIKDLKKCTFVAVMRWHPRDVGAFHLSKWMSTGYSYFLRYEPLLGVI